MKKYNEVDLNATNNQSEESGSESQLATAYIIYMMVGSFFKSCHPQSEIRMDSLFVHYSEMRVNSQYSIERRVEWEFTDKFADYLDVFAESLCEASVREEGGQLIIEFNTGLEKVTASVDNEGQFTFEMK